MTVRTINGNFPDMFGEISIIPLIVEHSSTIQGEQGVQGLVIPDETRQIKMWTGTTTTSGGSGEWSIDYSSAGFSEIRSIQITLESGITVAADKPLGSYVVSKSTTTATGKAYKATSAGLLAAMQQVAAENGVTVHVMVIGH